jgi:hypothetical protein
LEDLGGGADLAAKAAGGDDRKFIATFRELIAHPEIKNLQALEGALRIDLTDPILDDVVYRKNTQALIDDVAKHEEHFRLVIYHGEPTTDYPECVRNREERRAAQQSSSRGTSPLVRATARTNARPPN